MPENEVTVPEQPSVAVREFWRRKGLQARRVLNGLRGRLGHKMTPRSRSKLQLEILKTERAIKTYHDYETGVKIPPQPKEQEEMHETPRLIEIAYGPEPWRLLVNVMDIQSLNFLPKFKKQEDGSVTYEAFVVSVNVAGRIHDFPFNRATDAQGMYEYVKSEMAEVGIKVRTLQPTPIREPAPTEAPVQAANDELPQKMQSAEDIEKEFADAEAKDEEVSGHKFNPDDYAA